MSGFSSSFLRTFARQRSRGERSPVNESLEDSYLIHQFARGDADQLLVQKSYMLMLSPFFLVLVFHILARFAHVIFGDVGGLVLLGLYYTFIILCKREFFVRKPTGDSFSRSDIFSPRVTRTRWSCSGPYDWICVLLVVGSSAFMLIPFLNTFVVYDLTLGEWILSFVYATVNPIMEEKFWREMLLFTSVTSELEELPESSTASFRDERRSDKCWETCVAFLMIFYSALMQTLFHVFAFGVHSVGLRAPERAAVNFLYFFLWGFMFWLTGGDSKFGQIGHHAFDFLALGPVAYIAWNPSFIPV